MDCYIVLGNGDLIDRDEIRKKGIELGMRPVEEKIEFTKKDMMAQSISDVKEIRRANEILTQKVRSLRKILSED